MRSGRLLTIWQIAALDFKLTMREKSAVLWIFLMPLAFILFFGLSFGGGSGGVPKATLTIDNRDEGYLSDEMVSLLSGENYFIQMADTLGEGVDPVRTLILLEDFTKRVLGREKVELVLRFESGSNEGAGRAASAAIFRCLARLVTGLVETEDGLMREGSRHIAIRGDTLYGSLLLVSESGGGMAELVEERIGEALSRPPGITVRSERAGSGRETPGGFQSSVPGSLVMFVLMAMVFSGAAITAERQAGVLRRVGFSPAGRGDIIAGKLTGRILIASLQIIFLLAAGRLLFGISLGNDPLGLFLLMLAFAFAMGSLAILFGALLSNPDQVATIGVITAMAMAALGGCWWPLEVVSRPMRIVAYCLPTGWTITGIHKLISFGMSVSAVLPHITALIIFGAAFLAVGAARMKWDV